MPPLPTASPLVEPTRLLAAETVPARPVVPLPQVAAPTMEPLFCQKGLATTKLPLLRAVTPPLPTWSPPVEPTRLLLVETAPTVPVLPLLQVTAPTMLPP